MAPRAASSWFALFGVMTSACALAGYDFGDYQQAPAAGGAAAPNQNPSLAGAAGEPSSALTSQTGDHGPLASSGEGGSLEMPATAPFSVGGESLAASPGGGGAAGGAAGTCEPHGCFDQNAECGVIDDGCGAALDCGGCFWWFQECRQNRCEIAE